MAQEVMLIGSSHNTMQPPCTAQLARHTSDKYWPAKLRETWDYIIAAVMHNFGHFLQWNHCLLKLTIDFQDCPGADSWWISIRCDAQVTAHLRTFHFVQQQNFTLHSLNWNRTIKYVWHFDILFTCGTQVLKQGWLHPPPPPLKTFWKISAKLVFVSPRKQS